MNIHLEYLTGTAFSCTAGVWGAPFAALRAQEGGQTAIYVNGERAGWVGHE